MGVVIPGLLWKKWNRQWMTLDEEGAALRWYRDETRAGNDGTLYMKYVSPVACGGRTSVGP